MRLSANVPARTMMSESCRRTAFHYWLVDQEQPYVMISPSASVAGAKESLQVTFDGRVTRVEKIRTVSN